jgi:hypothetical protein
MLMKRLVVRLFFLAMFCVEFHNSAISQTADTSSNTVNHSWEGYAEASTSNTANLFGESGAGFRVGVGWKRYPGWGLVGDFESQPNSGSKHQSFTSAMAGPRVYFFSDSHGGSGFWQILGGAYRANFPPEAPRGAAWRYRVGAGLGADMRITRNITARLFELDFTFVGADVNPLFAPRASTGIAFCFGRR